MSQKIITIAVLSLFITGVIPPAFAGDKTPRIDWKYTIVLTSAMQKALKDYDPDFRIWEPDDFHPALYDNAIRIFPWQSLSVVFGDFNGDGILDAALGGYSKKYPMLIIVLMSQSRDNYKAIEAFAPLSAGSQETNHRKKELLMYLNLQKQGNVVKIIHIVIPDFKYDSIKLISPNSRDILFYWNKDKGKFNKYWIYDY